VNGEITTGKGKSWMKADIVSIIQEAFIRRDHIWKKGKGIYTVTAQQQDMCTGGDHMMY
jgi:hypothetical protein